MGLNNKINGVKIQYASELKISEICTDISSKNAVQVILASHKFGIIEDIWIFFVQFIPNLQFKRCGPTPTFLVSLCMLLQCIMASLHQPINQRSEGCCRNRGQIKINSGDLAFLVNQVQSSFVSSIRKQFINKYSNPVPFQSDSDKNRGVHIIKFRLIHLFMINSFIRSSGQNSQTLLHGIRRCHKIVPHNPFLIEK